jgi:hypothetical protein
MSDKIEFTPEFIAAQREIIQSATDGNWRVGMKPEVDGEQDYPGHWVGGYTGRDEYDRDMGVYVLAAFDDGNMTAYEPEVICTPWDESDARLIAEAHNNYPAALDEIERLRAAAEQAQRERIASLEAERDLLAAWIDRIGQWAGQVDENIHPIAGSLKWAVEQVKAGKYPSKNGGEAIEP